MSRTAGRRRAGLLQARGFAHPWLDRATELMWARIGELAQPSGYEMLGVVSFLEQVPDRGRAEAEFSRVGPLILERGLVALDPRTAGEAHTPLDFAPLPGSLARVLFEKRTDHLASAQRDDGGWMFGWLSWSPAAESDWRGFLTVNALRVLRANGRC